MRRRARRRRVRLISCWRGKRAFTGSRFTSAGLPFGCCQWGKSIFPGHERGDRFQSPRCRGAFIRQCVLPGYLMMLGHIRQVAESSLVTAPTWCKRLWASMRNSKRKVRSAVSSAGSRGTTLGRNRSLSAVHDPPLKSQSSPSSWLLTIFDFAPRQCLVRQSICRCLR